MKARRAKKPKVQKEPKKHTPTFLLELPLVVNQGQAKHVGAHLEAARQLYNALLGEAKSRMQRMRADPRWREASAIPRSQKQERQVAFSSLRKAYGFSEYALHDYAKKARCTWIAEHVDAMMAQTLATRAYRAVNQVCLGKARRVRFKSKGRGLDSVENKWTQSGLRFVLQKPQEGHAGFLLWKEDRLGALIDWDDPVVKYGLDHPIKFARLIRRQASSPRAQGADCAGYRYFVQLALEGVPYHKPKHTVGTDTIGLDLGPSTIAVVPREGKAELRPFCEDLRPKGKQRHRLERTLDRQRRANNPDHYDGQGRPKKRGKQAPPWKNSRGYLKTRRRLANQERKIAAHRKSLHGQRVHELMKIGNQIRVEKLSYTGWQKQFGRSVGRNAPGMFIELLKRTVARTGGTLVEVPTRTTKLSQFCHGCGETAKKPLWQRWHECRCGIGPVQRDLYSAFLVAYLNAADDHPSRARYESYWESAEPRLRAAREDTEQRAKEGQILPRSTGIPGARACLPKRLEASRQELVYRRGRLEALDRRQEPPVL
jgi:transposase